MSSWQMTHNLSEVIGLLRAPLVLIIITGKWGSHLHSTNPTSSGYQVNLFRFSKFWADANSNPTMSRQIVALEDSVSSCSSFLLCPCWGERKTEDFEGFSVS